MKKGRNNNRTNNKKNGSNKNNKQGGNATGNNPNTNTNPSRRRSREEIGNASGAIRRYDQEQAAREEYIKTSEEYNQRMIAAGTPDFCIPSIEEAEQHYKMDPSNPNRLLCNKDGGKWKIVLTKNQIYHTAIEEANSRIFPTFEGYKAYMTDKYYIDEEILDLLFKKGICSREKTSSDEEEKNNNAAAQASSQASQSQSQSQSQQQRDNNNGDNNHDT